jgi:hypothetical protein
VQDVSPVRLPVCFYFRHGDHFEVFSGCGAREWLFAGKKAPGALKVVSGAFIGFILGRIFKPSIYGWFVFCFIKVLVIS